MSRGRDARLQPGWTAAVPGPWNTGNTNRFLKGISGSGVGRGSVAGVLRSSAFCFGFSLRQIRCRFGGINKGGRWREVGREGGEKMRCGNDAGFLIHLVWCDSTGGHLGLFLQFLFYSHSRKEIWTRLLFKTKLWTVFYSFTVLQHCFFKNVGI